MSTHIHDAPEQSFPGNVLRSRSQVLLYTTTTTANTAMFSITLYSPVYFHFVHDDSSLMAAVRLLP